jgi:hypothetical protein
MWRLRAFGRRLQERPIACFSCFLCVRDKYRVVEVLTPMAIAGKMYFSRFLTSGRPWCLELSPLLVCRSMSPPSCSFSFTVCALSCAMPLSRSLECACLSALGNRGEVSLGREMFGAIAGISCANVTTREELDVGRSKT